MRKNRVDFAPSTVARAIILTRPWTWLMAAMAFFLCIGAILATRQFEQQRSAWQSGLAPVQSAETIAKNRAPVRHKNIVSESQAYAINNTIEQLNLPWSELMDALEQATPDSVALLELEPDAKRHVIKGVAEAESSDLMIDFIRRMKRQEFFGKVILTKHDINTQEKTQPYRFEFEAEWLEPAR